MARKYPMILRRDETFRVVFSLRTPAQGGLEKVGTGIFVAKENELFLVTANHVAIDCNVNTSLVISDNTGNATVLNLLDFNPKLQWIHHPIADLSAMPIIVSEKNHAHLASRFFPYDHFNLQPTAVSRDYELTSVGFPYGMGAQGKFSPLTYRSYASSSFVSFNRFDTKTPSEFFLLENPSVGGYSGGPIFDLAYMVVGGMTTTKDKTICYGLMHGTLSDETGGKLAAVTPSHYLTQII